MDVRAANISSLAAKRLDMEVIKPVKEKNGFHETEDFVERIKQQKEKKGQHQQADVEDEQLEELEHDKEHPVLDAKADIALKEEHILDVKV